jgi:hypothetical protein
MCAINTLTNTNLNFCLKAFVKFAKRPILISQRLSSTTRIIIEQVIYLIMVLKRGLSLNSVKIRSSAGFKAKLRRMSATNPVRASL